MILSLSTSYLQSRYADSSYDMLYCAREMGFEYVELGHSTPLFAVDGILRAVNENIVKVSSLHNFCPMPSFAVGTACNLFSPSSKNRAEGELWQKHTLNSLDLAKKTEAKAIVCHSGQITYFFRPVDYKIQKYLDFVKDRKNLKDDEKYIKIAETFKNKSAKKSQKHYEFLQKNIDSISGKFEENSVKIGLENRDQIPELPLDWNMAKMYEKHFLKSKTAFLWHDVGHSMKKQLLGLYDQLKLAEEIAPYQIGWHLHDCDENGKDHIAIGKGIIDFKALSKFFDAEKHIFTIELNKAVSIQDAVESRKRLEDIICGA